MRQHIYKKEKQSNVFQKKEQEKITNSELVSIFGFSWRERENADKKYLEICKNYGFPSTLYKKKKEVELEAEEYKIRACKNILKKTKSLNKMKLHEYLEAVDANEIKSNSIPIFQAFADYYKNLKDDKHVFIKLINTLTNINFRHNEKRIKNTNDSINNSIYIAVKNIFEFREYWNDNVFDYLNKSKSKNQEKMIFNFINHAFVQYKINNVFYPLWFEKESKFPLIFLKITKGSNPRKVLQEYLPDIKLTKKQVHNLITKPSTKSFFKSIRQAMLETYQPKIQKAVLDSNKAEDFKSQEELFQIFLIYLNNQDLHMFSGSQIMPLFDYIKYAKVRARRNQVTFNIKNHSLVSLYEQMLDWHKELNKQMHTYSWEPSIGDDIKEDIREKNGNIENKISAFIELTNTKELRQEGKTLKHCVSSYSKSCKNGICSIFSYRVKEFNSLVTKSLLTIEVRNKSIVQVRGKNNRLATKEEKNVVKSWANKHDLLY